MRLVSGKGPLRAAAFPLTPPPRRERTGIARGESVAARMDDLLAAPLAPSTLEAYIRCPARFFWERLCAIRPLDEVLEDDDPSGVGALLHEVLRQAYEPFVGREVSKSDIGAQRLAALFRAQLEAWPRRENLPAESLLMLKAAGPLRLARFLEAQPESCTPLEVEAEHSAGLEAAGRPHTLYGKLDRVDARPEGHIILDYKSGRVLTTTPVAFWHRDDLWGRMEKCTPASPDDPLPELADALPGIQLPCYLYLYSHGDAPDKPRPVADAAWVHLAGDGSEVPLLGPKLSGDERGAILNDRIPALLRFVLNHMRNAPELCPQPGRHCQWCPYAGLCR